jgi:alkylation response protein AidB-like acyl-CoA dehydrogenase
MNAWNASQLELRERYRREAVRLVSPGAAQRDRTASFDRGVWEALADTGFFRIHVPAEYGGDGLALADFAAALDGFTEGCEDFGFIIALIAQVGLFQGALAKYGSEEQKRRWLPRLMDGSCIGCFAITEPHAGSDVLRIKTRGRMAAADAIYLSGDKWNVTNAPVADVCLVFGRIPELGDRDITAFIAETGRDGVRRSAPLDLMGNRGTPTGHLTFENYRLSAGDVLGGLGNGIEVLYYAFLMERVLGGVALAAYMKPIIRECVVYALEREAFGRKIGEFQHIQERIVRMQVHHDLLASLAQRAVAAISADRDCTIEASIVKMFGADALVECATDAIKIFGNYGYRRERSFERKCREALGATIAGGTAEVHKTIIWKEIVQRHQERGVAGPAHPKATDARAGDRPQPVAAVLG